MAGDWMKIELELPDKPEIYRIAGIVGIEPDAVVGKLIRVWQWFNKHTLDGNAVGVSFALVDRLVSVSGFGEAMMLSGWLEQNDMTLTMPKFDRHTSESAKKRALTAKRVFKHTQKTNADSVKKLTPEELPREEKRREESKHKKIDATVSVADLVADGCSEVAAKELLSIRKKKRAALTPLAWSGILLEFRKANLSPDDGIATMSKRGWQSFDSSWIKGNGNATTRFDQLAATAAALTGRNRPADFIEGTAVKVD